MIPDKINWGKKALWDTFSHFRWCFCEASVNMFKEGRDKVMLPSGHFPRPWNPESDVSFLS